MDIVVIFWVLFSIVAGVVASGRGRSGAGYFALSLFISPLVGLILVALLPSLAEKRQAEAEGRVPCFQCAELVMPQALKCKHCGADLAAHRALQEKRRQIAEAEANAAAAAKRAERAAKNQALGRRLARILTGERK